MGTFEMTNDQILLFDQPQLTQKLVDIYSTSHGPLQLNPPKQMKICHHLGKELVLLEFISFVYHNKLVEAYLYTFLASYSAPLSGATHQRESGSSRNEIAGPFDPKTSGYAIIRQEYPSYLLAYLP
jgi:hypothetical protein